MSIVFHCEHCNKKISAPDEAGGKWGKCPSCHNKLYVPGLKPASEDDELKLAPIDEGEEQRQKRLMAETYKLTQNILQEREVPEESQPNKAAKPASGISDKKLIKYIVVYLRQMADGQLEKAEKTAKAIVTGGSEADNILNQISLGEKSIPELDDIPQQVLSGLADTLRAKIR